MRKYFLFLMQSGLQMKDFSLFLFISFNFIFDFRKSPFLRSNCDMQRPHYKEHKKNINRVVDKQTLKRLNQRMLYLCYTMIVVVILWIQDTFCYDRNYEIVE